MSEPTEPSTNGDGTTPTSSKSAAKPTSAAPVSAEPAAASVAPATESATTAAQYSRTETVTAVKYVAPDGADEPGNIDAIRALGLQVDQQNPWDPAGGQNCLLVGYAPPDEDDLVVRTLVQPGDMVVIRTDANAFEVYQPDDFDRQFKPQQ